MSDPLSVAASIVSVTVPALHSARLLLNDLTNIINAPHTVQSLKDDVASAETALQSLQGIQKPEWDVLGQDVASQSKAAIKNCENACKSFRANLQRWTRHSREGKLSWQDRANVGFFKEHQISAMSEQLQSCKITFNAAVGVATLYSSIRHTHITEEVKQMILVREAEVSSAITSTDTRLAAVEIDLGEIRLLESSSQQGQKGEDARNAVQQIEEERAGLSCSRELLETLLLKAQEDTLAEAVSRGQKQSTKITFGNNNSGFQTGIINGGVSGLSFGAK